jgi:hypothetical protein
MYVCMYVCMYVHTYACMYVCMYVCMYIYIYIQETYGSLRSPRFLFHNVVFRYARGLDSACLHTHLVAKTNSSVCLALGTGAPVCPSVCLSVSLGVLSDLIRLPIYVFVGLCACIGLSVCHFVFVSCCLLSVVLSLFFVCLSLLAYRHTYTRAYLLFSLSLSLSCLPASLQAGLACLPVCLSVRLFVCLFVCRFACLPACLHVTGGPQKRLIPWGLVFSHRFLSRSVSARKLALPPVLMRCRSRCASHLEASKTPRTVGICFFASFILTLRLPSKTGPPTRPASI